MSQQDKLKAIIERAVRNGWEIGELIWEALADEFEGYDLNATLDAGYGAVLWFIFDKQFLQAFFGEADLTVCPIDGLELTPELITYEEQCAECKGGILFPKAWQYYGQQLVLSNNRIDYLYGFTEQAK